MLSTSLRTAPAVLLLPVMLALAACSQAQTPPGKAAAAPATTAPASAAKGDRPAVLKGIEKHGFEVVAEFDAPGGLRGFAGVVGGSSLRGLRHGRWQARAGGQPVRCRRQRCGCRSGGEAGRRTDVGQDVDQAEASAWVRDGKADAPRVVYTFSDANCPYCHKFWEAARPWVDAGKVQLRHIMVGVIREDSPAKAAAILSARDPSAALLENEHQFDRGGIKALPNISREIAGKLDANQVLMLEMGFQGTPGILFQDAQGQVQRRAGLPQGDDLQTVLGPR
jgi:thiol:disulfide interchange protein DsbG